MLRIACPILLIGLLSLAAGEASAKSEKRCAATISSSSSLRIIYDPFQAMQQSQQLDVEIELHAGKNCRLALALAGAGSARQRLLGAGSKQLRYELQLNGLATANDLNAPTPLLASSSSKGSASKERVITVPLKIVLPQGQFAPAGFYEDQLSLRLYDVSSRVPHRIGPDSPLAVSVAVPARAQINLAGSSSPVFGGVGASGLYFGELREGAERSAYIQVRATAPVMLTLSSANRGLMQHQTEGGAQGISYALRVDGEAIDLARGAKRIDRAPNRGLEAENYRMAVRILDPAGRLAGTYEDVITITVEPK